MSESSIENWPVHGNNEVLLNAMKSSHSLHQLPAYNVNSDAIDPQQYEEKLAGAIAQVCFSIIHFFMKQKHIFNAVVRDICWTLSFLTRTVVQFSLLLCLLLLIDHTSSHHVTPFAP
jgi:hypothetical protein